MTTSDPMDRRRELIEEKKMWEGLLDLPQWQKLIGVLQEQADMLQAQVVFTPLTGADAAFAQEYLKGKLAGLLQVSKTVEGLMAEIQLEIDELTGEDDEHAS